MEELNVIDASMSANTDGDIKIVTPKELPDHSEQTNDGMDAIKVEERNEESNTKDQGNDEVKSVDRCSYFSFCQKERKTMKGQRKVPKGRKGRAKEQKIES